MNKWRAIRKEWVAELLSEISIIYQDYIHMLLVVWTFTPTLLPHGHVVGNQGKLDIASFTSMPTQQCLQNSDGHLWTNTATHICEATKVEVKRRRSLEGCKGRSLEGCKEKWNKANRYIQKNIPKLWWHSSGYLWQQVNL